MTTTVPVLTQTQKRFMHGTIASLQETLGEASGLLEKGRDGLLGTRSRLTIDEWHRLNLLIEDLELACPEYGGIIEARWKWYLMGLCWSEKSLAEIERGEDFSALALREFMDVVKTLHRYLRRSYLRGEFSDLFTRFSNLLRRAEIFNQLREWKRELHDLYEVMEIRLLDGSLETHRT